MAIPYQVILLGSPFYEDELRAALKDNPYGVQIVDEPEVLNPMLPTLHLYYGSREEDKSPWFPNDLKHLASRLEVLPVVKEASMFNRYIPVCLTSINAFILSDNTKVPSLVNHIYSHFGLIDATRKIFISYKQDETKAFAHQLFHELHRHRFLPFLDSYSIQPGLTFQEYLRHELSDSEIMVMLNSPHFKDSHFTMEEVTTAGELDVSILNVEFDGASAKGEELCFAETYSIGQCQGKDHEYDNAVLQEIIFHIEKIRALAYNARRRVIVDGLRAKGIVNESSVALQSGSILNQSSNQLIRPCVHVPKSQDFHSLFVEESQGNSKLLAFQGAHCTKVSKNHINWLGDVSHIKVSDVISTKS